MFVVNSCTVTAGGDKKSRQWLRRAKRQYPGAVTVLTGCYPQALNMIRVLVGHQDALHVRHSQPHLLEGVQSGAAAFAHIDQ